MRQKSNSTLVTSEKLVRDIRRATRKQAALQFSVNEVPNGIPMPPACCEIIKYAIGTQTASEFTLFGQVYDLEAASRMGVVQKTVASGAASGCRCRLGRSRDARLLSGLFIFQARLTGNDDGRDRFSGATSIWIGCRGVCRIPKVCARMHVATGSSRVRR